MLKTPVAAAAGLLVFSRNGPSADNRNHPAAKGRVMNGRSNRSVF